MKKVTDSEVREAWKKHRNFAEVGRTLGIAKQTAYMRVTRLMMQDEDLPPSLPVGHWLTSERARKIRQKQLRRRR